MPPLCRSLETFNTKALYDSKALQRRHVPTASERAENGTHLVGIDVASKDARLGSLVKGVAGQLGVPLNGISARKGGGNLSRREGFRVREG
jgi:hypothetical protein